MKREDLLPDLWRRFRLGGELRPLVCLVATVATGLILAGLGLSGGWLRGMLRPAWAPGPRLGDVRDGDIAAGLVIAGIPWLVLLPWLWRPVVRLNRHSLGPEPRQRWARPLAITVLLGAAMTVLSYVIYTRPWDDSEWVVTGLSLVAGGLALVFWLPIVFTMESGRPIVGRHGRVNLSCPQCGYSMVGLHESVCPECGRRYTIDELFAAQGYRDGEGGDESEKPDDAGAHE